MRALVHSPRRIFAALLMLSSVSSALGGPGDLLTLAKATYEAITHPEILAFLQANGGSLLNVVVFLVGLFIFFGRNPLARPDRSRPHLFLDGGEVMSQKMASYATMEITGTASFAYARFSNRPDGELTDRSWAKQVVAHVTYCDSERSPLYQTMIGRWSDLPEIGRGANILEVNQIDMPPNGMSIRADIAIKYPRERDAFGWNNESDQNSEVRQRRDMRFKLSPGTYEVKVELRGVNARAAFWLTLTNEGQGKSIQLVPSVYHRRGLRRLLSDRRSA